MTPPHARPRPRRPGALVGAGVASAEPSQVIDGVRTTPPSVRKEGREGNSGSCGAVRIPCARARTLGVMATGSPLQFHSPLLVDTMASAVPLNTSVWITGVDSSSDTANTRNTARRQFMMNAPPVIIIRRSSQHQGQELDELNSRARISNCSSTTFRVSKPDRQGPTVHVDVGVEVVGLIVDVGGAGEGGRGRELGPLAAGRTTPRRRGR